MLQVTIIPFIEEVGLEALKETFTEHHLEAATDFVEKLRSAKYADGTSVYSCAKVLSESFDSPEQEKPYVEVFAIHFA